MPDNNWANIWANIDANTIDNNFPMAQYREGQREAIAFAVNQFNAGKRIVIIEAPTGSGKSPIGQTIANIVRRSYYITVSKQLQDQLTADFPEVVELKGRNAYPCTFYNREGAKLVNRSLLTQADLNKIQSQHPDCSAGFCRTSLNKKSPSDKTFHCTRCFTVGGPHGDGKLSGELAQLPPPNKYSACPYYEQVYKALAARKVTMNFSSFLFQTTMTNRFPEPRDLLIIDECHQIESQILDFVAFSITDMHLQRYGVYIPELESPFDYYNWFIETKVASMLDSSIKQARLDDNPKLEEELVRVAQKFTTFMQRIKTAGVDSTNREWVSEYEEKGRGSTTYRSTTIKPIYAREFAQDLLFKHGTKVLLMSATVLDVNVLTDALGINKSEVASYRMKNRFPVSNRPIHLHTVAKMTGGKENMANWAPQLVEAVNDIVQKHPGQKGIVHTHNNVIMDHLMARCDPAVVSRMLCQRNFRDKTEMLEEHRQRSDTVIVAPAMHEGVDLYDDLSRFQILCKCPFANYYINKQLARRIEADRRYYLWMTAIKLCQSYGRSIRSETDWAVTYILDESIHKFLRDARSMLPVWFLEAIIEE